eukprot:8417907-Ditylum_brightwellii.AAC.1
MEIHQECPSKQSWQLWCKAMTLWTNTIKLEKPLGRWCKTSDELDRRWPVYFDHDDYALSVRTTHGYTKYSRNENVGDIFRCPKNTD